MADLQEAFDQQASRKSHRKPAGSLPVVCLNHVSRVCKDMHATATFYREVLGFFDIKRPDAFTFKGLWLYNCNIGVHLIEGEPVPRSRKIDPKEDHLSFQAHNLADVEERLKGMDIQFFKQVVKEGPYMITQLFFLDPDANMIEICDCNTLPIIPLSPTSTHNPLSPPAPIISVPATANGSAQAMPFPLKQQQHTPRGAAGGVCSAPKMAHRSVQVPAS